MLYTYKAASQTMFTPVPNIMKHRYFWLVGDDGGMDISLGSDGLVGEAALTKEVASLKERSLRETVLPAVLNRAYSGIGSGRFGSAIGRVLPRRVAAESIRVVRLFMKESEEEMHLTEVRGRCKVKPGAEGVYQVNKALELVATMSHEDLQKCMRYGKKSKHIETMYKLYVPKERVPPAYEAAAASEGRNFAASGRQYTLDEGAAGDVAIAAGAEHELCSGTGHPLKAIRFNSRVHKEALLAIVRAPPYNGVVPKG
jgi:hypothetical protein